MVINLPRRRTGMRKSRDEKKEREYKGTQNSNYNQFSEKTSYDIQEMNEQEEVSFESIPKKSKIKKKKTAKGKARFVLVVFLMLITTGVIGIGIGKLLSLIL